MGQLIAKRIGTSIYFVRSEYEDIFDKSAKGPTLRFYAVADIIINTKTNTVTKSRYPIETIIAEWSRLKEAEWYLNTIIGNGVDHEQSK